MSEISRPHPRSVALVLGICQWAERSDLFGSFALYAKRVTGSSCSSCRSSYGQTKMHQIASVHPWLKHVRLIRYDSYGMTYGHVFLLIFHALFGAGTALLRICGSHLPYAWNSNKWCRGGKIRKCSSSLRRNSKVMTCEPRSKLSAIDFSIRWNLFFQNLNGVTRAQAFHKLRASSCTRKLRASPKSRKPRIWEA